MYLKILISLMLLPTLSLSFMGANIKIYMVFALVYFFIGVGYMVLKRILILEFFAVSVYFIIGLSVFYAENFGLAMRLLLGQVVLMIAYIVYRTELTKLNLFQFERLFINVGRIYVLLSLIFYLMGIVGVYFLGVGPSESMYVNEHSWTFYGAYFERTLPRLMGLSESPNNYLFFTFLFMLFFRYKEKKGYEFIALLSLILTVSGTALIVLVLYYTFLFIVSKTNLLLKLLLPFSFVVLGRVLYVNVGLVKDIVDLRVLRLSTGSGRYELWDFVTEKISESPLLGYGANQSRLIIESHRGLNSAHNSFLDMFLTTGVLGFMIYCLLHLSLAITSLKLSQVYHTEMFVVLYVFLLLVSMSNNTLHIDYLIFYFGFLFVYLNNRKRRRLVL
ncbi:MAG: O-antigen ligase family protein [Cocleimonas sp.]